MKTRAAVLWDRNKEWSVEDIKLDPPKQGEVLVALGINAVQAAVALGAEYVVAVDPVAFKRNKALEFGASHAVASSQEAAQVVTELTRGRMAQVCVNTMGVGEGARSGRASGWSASAAGSSSPTCTRRPRRR